MLAHKRQAEQLKENLQRCADLFKNAVDEIINLIEAEQVQPAPSVTESPSNLRSSLVTIKEAAEYLGTHTRSIHQWIADEGFPARHAGRALRFDLAEVDEWTRRRKTVETRRLTMVR
ncbi:MAG TPA: helix-turn-helix domain-containing protein [Blastocatellia bacterium]|nr:helix-turn-helix domain-containing protein [Blastocatellia bacterium]